MGLSCSRRPIICTYALTNDYGPVPVANRITSSVAPALFRLALFLEPGAFAHELLLDFIHLFGLLLGVGEIELLLQKDLPLGELSFEDLVDLGEPGFFGRGDRLLGGEDLSRRSIASS